MATSCVLRGQEDKGVPVMDQAAMSSKVSSKVEREMKQAADEMARYARGDKYTLPPKPVKQTASEAIIASRKLQEAGNNEAKARRSRLILVAAGLAAALVGWGVVKAATRKRHGQPAGGAVSGAGVAAGDGDVGQDCGALLAAKTACEQEVEELCAIMGVKATGDECAEQVRRFEACCRHNSSEKAS